MAPAARCARTTACPRIQWCRRQRRPQLQRQCRWHWPRLAVHGVQAATTRWRQRLEKWRCGRSGTAAAAPAGRRHPRCCCRGHGPGAQRWHGRLGGRHRRRVEPHAIHGARQRIRRRRVGASIVRQRHVGAPETATEGIHPHSARIRQRRRRIPAAITWCGYVHLHRHWGARRTHWCLSRRRQSLPRWPAAVLAGVTHPTPPARTRTRRARRQVAAHRRGRRERQLQGGIRIAAGRRGVPQRRRHGGGRRRRRRRARRGRRHRRRRMRQARRRRRRLTKLAVHVQRFVAVARCATQRLPVMRIDLSPAGHRTRQRRRLWVRRRHTAELTGAARPRRR